MVEDASLTELLFAYAPQLISLQYRNGRPRLPKRLLPLGHILFSEEVRPDAQQTVSAFSEAGITLKILTSESEENVLAMSHEVGLLTSVAILAGNDYFPYLPDQDFLITIITITIPAIGPSLWSEPDRVRASDLGRGLGSKPGLNFYAGRPANRLNQLLEQ